MTNSVPNPPYVAEIIAIGDELTSGQRLDTNTQWLASRLTEAGLRVRVHTTVADDLEAHIDSLRAAGSRASIVVTTGGLGPTADDLTREAMASAAEVPLIEDPKLLRRIEQIFSSRGRTMPEQNRRQALLPEGAAAIPNPGGTAPGVDQVIGKARFFALPGVPAEMREMWSETVAPAVAAMTGSARVTRHWLVKCFGKGESSLEGMIPEIIARGREPLVGITASHGTITLRVSASGSNESACYEAMQPTLEEIREKLGTLIYAEHPGDQADATLEQVVVEQLRLSGSTLSSSEVMTCGLLGHWLATADPTGEIFVGGRIGRPIVGAENEVGDYRLEVSERQDTVVPIALVGPEERLEKTITLVGHPSIHKPLIAKHALNLLRLELIED